MTKPPGPGAAVLPVSRRKNVQYKGEGQRRRLPDVPGIRLERPWWDEGAVVCGVDEVGRGAWAGPVTFAAVVLPSDRRMYKLRDSKVLDPLRREQLSARIFTFALAVAIGHASNEEIDRHGMSAAMRAAARRAVDGLAVRPDVCLLDGNWDFLSGYGTRNERVIGGDAHSASIAAASIVAKVCRDRLMKEACPAFPAYRFSSNKGYPSPEHQATLAERGPCRLHRLTWTPVAASARADGRGDPAALQVGQTCPAGHGESPEMTMPGDQDLPRSWDAYGVGGCPDGPAAC